MPTTPLLHLTLPTSEGPEHFAPLQIALEAMCKINEWHIRHRFKQWKNGLAPTPPIPLYLSGVRYQEDPPGHEDWRDMYGVLARGVADCDQLVAWRVGELRAAGIQCEPVLKWQWIPRDFMISTGYPAHLLPADGVWMVHCLVRYANGTVEDPSKILGMGGEYTNKV